MAKVVTKIESTINPFTKLPQGTLIKRRVAAYARVSTDNEEQLTSYEAQVDYYTKYIERRPDWSFAGIYTDEGISGTNTKRREGFKRMIDDAMNGKIDLIITKSISRFARNTVDSLVNIRKLKEHNVECYFEKENIYTFDSKGELLITIMSSLAQEESRSISQNVTWGQRKRFADGKVSMPYKAFLGYEKGENSDIVINDEEAKVVRRIYYQFLKGDSLGKISADLTNDGVLTPRGKTNWTKSTLLSILKNEKYKGDALLQKSFTVNFLEHKTKKNEGEVPQYYVQDSHPAIIPKEDWELVQIELTRRKDLGYTYSYKNPFVAKLYCEDCGGYYGKKKWHSGSTYEKEVLQCNDKFKNKCHTPTLEEDDVKRRFLKAYNLIISNKESIIKDIELVISVIGDSSKIDGEINKLTKELEEMANEFNLLVKMNTKTQQDQSIWRKKYAELEEKYKKKESEYKKLVTEKEERKLKESNLKTFIEMLKKGEAQFEWDETIFNFTLEKAIVHKDKSITFKFYSGYEVTIKAEG
ncbi:MAG TPA: recombinase family protein [Candidatus Enterosoma merdigallinarum]|nr:recombinase family protein [Candidatus Enterosoma merdigallinarum]